MNQQAGVRLNVAIDVGGTNTDAVCLDSADRMLAKAKVHTTRDVSTGMREALDIVLGQLGPRAAAVGRVMLGTTHATNAVLQRRSLVPTAAIRIGAPATTDVPPMTGWPSTLKAAASAGSTIIGGGHFIDGSVLTRLDLDALDRFLDDTGDDAGAYAVTGVFSPATPDHELIVADFIRSRFGPDTIVSLSHEVGALGLLERENATILNSTLSEVARTVTSSLDTVLAHHGVTAATFFAQNDGTLMAIEYAARYPVLTIGSGPANSIRGAAFLSGLDSAIVADIGGTSSDFGVISGGFPRESSLSSDIGGVRTNFPMPDTLALAIGGGSIVTSSPDGDARLGPESVGYRIVDSALVFGGDVPTLTDAAIAGGRGGGPAGTVSSADAERHRLAEALEIADHAWATAVDRVSLGKLDRPLVVVGGGSFMVPDRVPGTSSVIRPDNADVANAVGAAIAPVSGRAEVLYSGDRGRSAAIEDATAHAVERAVQAGAQPDTVETISVSETPLSYLQEPTTRVTVKVAGRMGWI